MDKEKKVVYRSRKPDYCPPHEVHKLTTVLRRESALKLDENAITSDECKEVSLKLKTLAASGTPLVIACTQLRKEHPYSMMNPERVQTLFAAAHRDLLPS